MVFNLTSNNTVLTPFFSLFLPQRLAMCPYFCTWVAISTWEHWKNQRTRSHAFVTQAPTMHKTSWMACHAQASGKLHYWAAWWHLLWVSMSLGCMQGLCMPITYMTCLDQGLSISSLSFHKSLRSDGIATLPGGNQCQFQRDLLWKAVCIFRWVPHKFESGDLWI